MLDGPVGLSDGVGRSRARGDYVDAGTIGLKLNGHLACCHISYDAGNEIRRNPASGRIFQNFRHLALNGLESADSAADVHAQPEWVDVFAGHESAVLHRLIGRSYGVYRKFILLSYKWLIHTEVFGDEIPDLASYLHFKSIGRKALNIVYSTLSVDKIFPKSVHVVSQARQDTKSCYYYSFRHK